MVLSTQYRDLVDEIKAAEEANQDFLGNFQRTVERYHGKEYRNSAPGLFSDPENHQFEWVSLMMPRLVSGNPKVRVKTARFGAQRDVAIAQEAALNRWIRDTKMRVVNEKLAMHFGFRWAVGMVTRGPAPGFSEPEDPKRRPAVKALSPSRYVRDPKALTDEDCRFKAHLVVRDRGDLIKDKDFNNLAVSKLQTYRQHETAEAGSQDRNFNTDRDEVSYWEVWIPEVQVDKKKPEDGFNGSIWTVAPRMSLSGKEGEQQELRPPRPYYGPPSGPYTLIGGYLVPDLNTPLAPLVATASQAEFLNNIARANADAIEHYKRIIAVAGDEPDLQQKVKDAKHDYVLAFENMDELSRNVAQFEIGGTTQQILAAYQLARETLDRNSGIHDAMRGNVQGTGTATEVATADAASSARVGFLQQKFVDGIQNILEKVSWYLYHDDSVEFALGPEASERLNALNPETGEPLELIFRGGTPREGDPNVILSGGDPDESKGATWWDLELEIDPYSMSRTTEEQMAAEVAEMNGFIMQVLPMMPQAPYFAWDEYLQWVAERRNMPRLPEMVDMEAMLSVAELMLQAQVAPQQGSKQPQPRQSRDIGAKPNVTISAGGGRHGGNGQSASEILGKPQGAAQ